MNDFEEFERSLGRCVRDIRLKSGTTQSEFAGRTESLRQSTIAKFESGATASVTLKTVFEVAKASFIPLSELIKKAEGTDTIHKDKWDDVVRDVNQLPENKKDWLGKIVRDVLKGES